MKRLALVFVVVVVGRAAMADSEDQWPLHHPVLAAQRAIPCAETWTAGADTTTYVMKIDPAGQLSRREDGGGEWKTYRHDRRGRIVRTEGASTSGGENTQFVSDVRYGARGIESIKTRTTSTMSAIGGKTETHTSRSEMRYLHGKDSGVRVQSIVEGKTVGEDVEHYTAGRLSSIDLAIGGVETATYDKAGRLESMTTSYQGTPSDIHRYSYDAEGRLAREDFDDRANQTIDQSHVYTYDCSKH